MDFTSGLFTATRWPNGNGWDIVKAGSIVSKIYVASEEIKNLRRLLAKLDEYENKLPPRAR